MVCLHQVALEFFVRLSPMQPWMIDDIVKASASAAQLFLPFEKKQVALERHPLQTLHLLVQRALEAQPPSGLQEALTAVPENLRNAIFYEVWSQATDPHKGGERWGEIHALDNLSRLISAIKAVVEKKLDALSEKEKNAVFGTVFLIAGQPQTFDLQWGERNAKGDTQRLIRALNRRQCLDIPGKEILVFSDLEKDIAIPSHAFHLYRPELPQGQIGLHNGMYNSLSAAYANACTLSTDLARGFNLHCTYGATVNPQWDVASAVLGQGGAVTPPVLHLLEQWQDFFEKDDNNRLLQICHSRGAAEVSNALSCLSQEQRQRIIVIAIAPARLLAPEQAYKVVNLVILADPVLQVAANRSQLFCEHTLILDSHSNSINPHDLNGSSFREKLGPMIETYINTNDI